MLISSLASKMLFSNNNKKPKRQSIISPRQTIPRPSICIPDQEEVEEVEIETPMIKLIKKVRLLQALDQADIILINEMSRENILSILMEYSNAIKFFIGVKQIR